MNQLPEPQLCDVLPLMANLIFLAKHNYTHVSTKEARNVVLKFRDKVTSSNYVLCEHPDNRLKLLMETVDTVRKYSDYLLRLDGYEL